MEDMKNNVCVPSAEKSEVDSIQSTQAAYRLRATEGGKLRAPYWTAQTTDKRKQNYLKNKTETSCANGNNCVGGTPPIKWIAVS